MVGAGNGCVVCTADSVGAEQPITTSVVKQAMSAIVFIMRICPPSVSFMHIVMVKDVFCLVLCLPGVLLCEAYQ